MPDAPSNGSLTSKPSALFMGTPSFAIPSLRALKEHSPCQLVGVVTQPDRPGGRGMKLQPPPVKPVALELGLKVFQPEKLQESLFRPILEQLPALDFIFVVAYGKKIPEYLLNYSRYGCINLHPSLLPKYRGGAPIQRALFNGDPETGVSTMYLDQGWDTGDMILQEKVAIAPDWDHGQLEEVLAQRGAALLIRTVERILDGSAPRIPQDESQATHEPLLKREDEWIDWSWSAEKIHNRIRGLSPEPAAKTVFRNISLKLLRSEARMDVQAALSPGTILEADKTHGLLISTGSGVLEIKEVQPAGKRRMTALDFINGYQIQKGEILTREI